MIFDLRDRLRAIWDAICDPYAIKDLVQSRQQWFNIANGLEDDLSDAVFHLDRLLRRTRGARGDATLFRNQMTRYLDDPEDFKE